MEWGVWARKQGWWRYWAIVTKGTVLWEALCGLMAQQKLSQLSSSENAAPRPLNCHQDPPRAPEQQICQCIASGRVLGVPRLRVFRSLPPPSPPATTPGAEMADEEPVNPQLEVEESCKPQCVKLLLEYQVRGCGRARCPGWTCSDRL